MGSVMREEGVTFTEQAAGTRVWWKRLIQTRGLSGNLWSSSEIWSVFSADPSTKELCVNKELFPFFWGSGNFTVFAGRETTKTLMVLCVCLIWFFPVGLQFPLFCAAFRVCDLWQLYSFTPAEFYSSIRWYLMDVWNPRSIFPLYLKLTLPCICFSSLFMNILMMWYDGMFW